MNPQEISKLQAYMRKTFNNSSISVKARPKKADSAELYIGEEFVGVLFKDEDEDYNFTMAILAIDLD